MLGFRPDGPWQPEDLTILHEALSVLRRIGPQSDPSDRRLRYRPCDELALYVSEAMMSSGDPSLAEPIEELLHLAVRHGWATFWAIQLKYERYCRALGREPRNFSEQWAKVHGDE